MATVCWKALGRNISKIDSVINRTQVNLRDTNDVNYAVDNLTNRYNSVGGSSLTYDEAGNLTVDKDGYGYKYDYENRIVEVNDSNGTIAEFAYTPSGEEANDSHML